MSAAHFKILSSDINITVIIYLELFGKENQKKLESFINVLEFEVIDCNIGKY